MNQKMPPISRRKLRSSVPSPCTTTTGLVSSVSKDSLFLFSVAAMFDGKVP